MDQSRPIVVRAVEGAIAQGPPTPGMERRQIMDEDNTWVGWVRAEAGLAGGWHHHGDRESYIYVLSGRVTIGYGPGGSEEVKAVAGDFIYNPARMIHREITGADEPAELFVVRVGTGPQNVNVDGPDPG